MGKIHRRTETDLGRDKVWQRQSRTEIDQSRVFLGRDR
jgi:hypothetical protein